MSDERILKPTRIDGLRGEINFYKIYAQILKLRFTDKQGLQISYLHLVPNYPYLREEIAKVPRCFQD